MPELEDQLTALAPELDWPPTPDLVVFPTRREGGAQRRKGTARGPHRWALAAAAVLLIAALLLAYTPTRSAIAGWINLHTIVQHVQHPPTPTPLPSGTLGKRLGLGEPTTLDQAQSQVNWHITVPSSLGKPVEVFLQLPPLGPSGGEVTLVYASRPDIKTAGTTGVAVLVTEARGAVDENYFGKSVGQGTTLEDVTVNGHPGWWLSGQPHVFFFTDESGQTRDETLRLATNTLIFDNGGTIVRIEGDMPKEKALQIANSLG